MGLGTEAVGTPIKRGVEERAVGHYPRINMGRSRGCKSTTRVSGRGRFLEKANRGNSALVVIVVMVVAVVIMIS